MSIIAQLSSLWKTLEKIFMLHTTIKFHALVLLPFSHLKIVSIHTKTNSWYNLWRGFCGTLDWQLRVWRSLFKIKCVSFGTFNSNNLYHPSVKIPLYYLLKFIRWKRHINFSKCLKKKKSYRKLWYLNWIHNKKHFIYMKHF